MNLEYIEPTYISEIWETIKEGLGKVRKHGDDWLVEDVYMSLKLNQSILHVGYIDGEYIGFIITQQETTVSGPSLHIWCTYSKANDNRIFYECLPTLKEWAGRINAKKITFKSPRKGWEKKGRALGFEPTQVIYTMKLNG